MKTTPTAPPPEEETEVERENREFIEALGSEGLQKVREMLAELQKLNNQGGSK